MVSGMGFLVTCSSVAGVLCILFDLLSLDQVPAVCFFVLFRFSTLVLPLLLASGIQEDQFFSLQNVSGSVPVWAPSLTDSCALQDGNVSLGHYTFCCSLLLCPSDASRRGLLAVLCHSDLLFWFCGDCLLPLLKIQPWDFSFCFPSFHLCY